MQSDNDDLTLLYELSVRLLNYHDVGQVLKDVLQTAAKMTGASHGSAQVFDSESGRLRMSCLVGFDQSVHDKFEFVAPTDCTVCAKTLRSRKRTIVEDIGSAHEFEPVGRMLAELGARGAVSTPIFESQDKIVAVFTVYFGGPHRATPHELYLLDLCAGMAVRHIERARVEAALKEAEDRRKEAEEDIRRSELRYRTLVEATSSVTWRSPPSGLHILPQHEWMAFTGQTFEEMIGDGWTKAVHPDDLPVASSKWIEAIARGEAYSNEHRIRRHDGDWRWMSVKAVPVKNAHGKIVEWFGMNIDITDRKTAEYALRLSEEKFRTLADTAPALIWQNDANGENVFINKFFVEFTGKSEAEIKGEGWHDLLEPDHAQSFIDDYMAAVRERRSWQNRNRVKGRDGKWRWFEDCARPLIGENGEYLGHVGVSTEIDALVEAKVTLEKADKRKEDFLATLAHELRNPLAAINNSLAVFDRSDYGTERHQKMIKIMQRQTSHLVRLVDDLLELSRISHGKIELRRETTDVAIAVRLALETSEASIKSGGHKLTLIRPSVSLPVFADTTRLSQVFSNLLNNAAKFTPAGGLIELLAKREGNEAVVSVRDNGKGIAPEQLSNIFDLFAQADSEGTGGLGIGLSLARGLISLHGGTISAHSDGLGKGSEFIVRLPMTKNYPEAEFHDVESYASVL